MSSELVKKTVLPNGLRVVTEALPDRESVSIGVWVGVGSRHETQEAAGVSHFLEHMVFKGTPTRSAKEIAYSLERLGGLLNAFTTREHTCFHARILSDDLPVAVDVLAELSTRATLPGGEVVKERKVISEEIKDTEDTPHEHIHDLFAEHIWPGHPMGRPIAGTLATVNATTRASLAEHRKHFYRPDRILIAASGGLSHSKVLALVKKYFRFSDVTRVPVQTEAPNGRKPVRAVVGKDISQTHVVLGFPTWPFADKRRYTSLVATNLLGGGMSSRLFQSVREKRGLVYSIYSFQDSLQDAGYLAVYFACDPTQVVEASNLVLAELGKLSRNKISATELHDAKSQLKGNLALGLESTSSRMHRLARHELYLGGHVSPKQTLKSIDKVSSADIAHVSSEAFVADNVAMTILGPVDEGALSAISWDKLKPTSRHSQTASVQPSFV